jgi:oligoribonuclease NrnB/cAMP/cGMP phosphodiesterase (DHH superfamily)
MKTLVVSHIADLDGVSSAVLVSNYLLLRDGVAPEVIFADYEDAYDKVTTVAKDKDEIWICDLSWKPVSIDLIDKLSHIASQNILFFDHHKSSKECFDAWSDRATFFFDYSGAKCTADLLWEYLHSNFHGEQKLSLEKITLAAHSRDLWVRNDPDGCYISDVIDVFGAESVFQQLMQDPTLIRRANYPPSWNGACKQAEASREDSYELAMKSKMTAYLTADNGNLVPVSACLSNGFVSEVGNRILTEMDGGIVGFIDVKLGTLSFRAERKAIESLNVGVNEIAAMMHPNGGGHPYAAGAAMSNEYYHRGTNFLFSQMNSFIEVIMKSKKAP